uniref:Uncharacterized protein n=3 Tax=Phlebotomus papatasi TaxID=29031 RepID=A0A1B0D0A8_PHLPP
MSDFGGVHCEKLLGHSHSHSPGNTAAIVVPITVILLVLLAAGGVWFVIRKRPFGKMARLSNLSSSQSVSFRHGTNVEFNSPGFPPNGPTPASNVAPLDGYNLETVTTKSRDFSNPMYDAVQSGTTTEPNMENGSGIYEVPGNPKPKTEAGHFTEPVSAILAPSSITHRTSPQLQLRARELDPSADTGKDTQQLVEEDKSDC